MDSQQLEHAATDMGISNFLGVFSLDEIPVPTSQKDYCFIINNQTSNLPGKHWIGVNIVNNSAHIYDPLGSPPPSLLINNLRRHLGIKHISYSKREYQKLGTNNCGPLVLRHLR